MFSDLAQRATLGKFICRASTERVAHNATTQHPGDLRALNNRPRVFDGMTINIEKLQAELARVHAAKPYLFVTRLYVPNAGKTPEHQPRSNGWQDAFTPKGARER